MYTGSLFTIFYESRGRVTGLTDVACQAYTPELQLFGTVQMPETTIPGVYACGFTGAAPGSWLFVCDSATQPCRALKHIYVQDSAFIDNIAFLRSATGGRWRILSNQMIFYGEDNVTEIMRFDLFDSFGNPAMTGVFERQRIS